MRRLVAAMLALAAGAGCSGAADCLPRAEPALHLRFADPAGDLEDFGAHPWPSDALKRPSGTLRLDHFPNPTGSSTLEDYVRLIAQHTRAYATSAAQYTSFSAPLEPASLPQAPQDTLQDGATVFLVDVDPDSPDRGRRAPLSLRFSAAPSLHLPANHLVTLPVYGSGLRSDTTYALVLTDDVRGRDGAPLERSSVLRAALQGGCRETAPPALFEAFAPLRDFLDDDGFDADRVAGATVFTTQPAVEELRALAEVAREVPAPEVRDWAFDSGDARTFRLGAEVDLPGFQSGTRPFRGIEDGGGLSRGDDGRYAIDHLETTRIGVALPQGGQMPPSGWPVVLYSHGTGGDYTSGWSDSIAGELSRRGVAVVTYDQTLHGPRDPTGSDPELTFFNLFNPLAARDNVRQGAADLVVMTTLVERVRIPASATAGRGEVFFDPDRLAFVGHSQGALVGAPFAIADARPRAHVFSGLGAVLAITLLERKDIVDFEALLTSLLGYDGAEALDEMHPVVNLLQTFIEPADPIAYAQAVLTSPPSGYRSDVLMVEGLLDFASPARGQEAYASAAGLPVIAPVHRVPQAAALLGPEPQDGPASGNVDSAAGPVTAGLIQYPDEDHFPIFRDMDANQRFVEFVRSALLDGGGVIP